MLIDLLHHRAYSPPLRKAYFHHRYHSKSLLPRPRCRKHTNWSGMGHPLNRHRLESRYGVFACVVPLVAYFQSMQIIQEIKTIGERENNHDNVEASNTI